MNDRMAVEFAHGGHDAILELVFGRGADVTQDRAGEPNESHTNDQFLGIDDLVYFPAQN
jgi:hypothetical protein